MFALPRALTSKGPRLALVTLLVAAGAWLCWWEPTPLLRLHEAVWDRLVEIRPRLRDPASKVLIVDIDEASLAAHGQWPWPRSRIARLVRALAEGGARIVAFDVVFAEPDAGSVRAAFETLRRDLEDYTPPLSEAAIRAEPDSDAVLAAALSEVPVILGFTIDKSRHGEKTGVGGLKKLPRVKFERRKDQRYLPRHAAVVAALPALQAAARGNGGLDMVADPDGITRRVPMLYKIGKQTAPSLALAVVIALRGEPPSVGTRSPGLDGVVIGPLRIPTDRHGRMRLFDSGSKAARFVSAANVLDASVPPARLDGAIVIVGTGAEGLGDLRLTPLTRWVPGMETHAQAIEQILGGDHLVRPEWGRTVEAGATVALALLLLLLTWRNRPGLPPWSAALLAAVVLGAGAWHGFAEYRLLLDPATPMATLALAAAGERFLLVVELRRERGAVRDAFSRYLAPAMVDQVAQDPSRLVLGGEMRRMTFLFCDVRGFTSISEGYRDDPQGLIRLINRFLTPMTDAILARGGTIDKYMGDCIMAFWNAPLAEVGHAARACEAALAMLTTLEDLNATLAAEAASEDGHHPRLAIGIGLNTGECVVGNMGSEQRFDYSVLGDAVNLASRLEGQSKFYGVDVVMGENTCVEAAEFAALELDRIVVKGKVEAVTIHTLLGAASVARDPAFRALVARQEEMLGAYRAGNWDRAERLLEDCHAGWPQLGALTAVYRDRITHNREHPPEATWDGVFVADRK